MRGGKYFLVLTLPVLAAVGTLYLTGDDTTWHAIQYFSWKNIVLSLMVWGLGMYFDGLRLQKLVEINGYRVKLFGILQVIFSNYFMGLLTPGAAGGAVAQMLVLKSIGVPINKSSMIVLIRTVFSILFLIMVMPIVFWFDPINIPYIGKNVLFYIALLFLFGCFLGGWIFVSSGAKRMVFYILKTFSCRLKTMKKMIHFFHDWKSILLLLKKHYFSTIQIFFYSGLSLCCLYSVLPALLLNSEAFDNYFLLIGRMIALNFILYFAPTPGGTGVAEGGFVLLFRDLVPSGTVGVLAVVWRVISEYVPFFIGMYFVLNLFGKKYLFK